MEEEIRKKKKTHASEPDSAAEAPKKRKRAAEEDAPVRKKKRSVSEAPAEESLAETPEAGESAEDAADEMPRPKKKSASGKKRHKKRRRKRRSGFRAFLHGLLIFLLVLLILAAAAACGIVYWGYKVTNNGVMCPNVYAGGVSIGNQTYEEAMTTLGNAGWDEAANTPLTVKLPKDITLEISRVDSGAMPAKETVVAKAMAYGHDGNLLENLQTWLENYMGSSYDACDTGTMMLSAEYLMTKAAEGQAAYQAATAYSDYVVDQENSLLTMVKGCGEVSLDVNDLVIAMAEALADNQVELTYDTIVSTAQMPDFNAIYNELAIDPIDAWYDDETKEIVPSEDGVTFDVEQAKLLWEEAELTEVVSIPVLVVEPEVTTESLSNLLFKDVLGEKTTYYTSSTDARINNINLAASKIDGVVLNPGETFSYNETVGQRTLEAGFQEAAAYSDGEVVQEVGGGICQVSSTLYCSTLYANLKTVSRTPHYFPVDYIDKGQDATVSWGKPDFKFANNREYPIMIHAFCDNDERSLTIQILGTDVDGSYVELGRDTYTIFDDTYTDVAVGYGVQEYRLVYDADGNLIDTIREIYDIYHFHDYDIKWPADRVAD